MPTTSARGRGFQFSDTAIETVLMLKGFFGLSLEGFIHSLFGLMDVPLRSQDDSGMSKWAKTVAETYRNSIRGAAAHWVGRCRCQP